MRSIKKKRIIAILMVMVLMVCLNMTGGSITVSAKTVNELKCELDELESKASQIETQIASLRKSKDDKEGLRSSLDERIENTESQIRNCNAQIELIETEVANLEKSIAETEKKLEDAKELFKQRLRAIYMSGSNNEVLVLLGSDDLADYLAKSELVRSVSKRDNALMEQISADMAELEVANQKMDEKLKEQKVVQKTLATKKQSLNSQMFEASEAIETISNQTTTLNSKLSDIEAAMEEYENNIAKALEEAKKSQLKYTGGTFGWPTPGFYNITSPFGYRIHPITKQYSLHGGTDIASIGIAGTAIQCAADGTVLTSQYNSSYGNYVLVYHGEKDGNEYATLYAHMSSQAVIVGQSVKAGQTLGYVGSTGSSTAPHLHYEIRVNGTRVDPMQYY